MNLRATFSGTWAISVMLVGCLSNPLAAICPYAEPDDEDTPCESLSEEAVRQLVRERGWAGNGRGSTFSIEPEEMLREYEGIAPGAVVTVYFGMSCPHSQQELPRLFTLLDHFDGEASFSTRFVRVDQAQNGLTDSPLGDEIQALPTFVLTRDGKEIGRIVERAPRSLEQDLSRLLTGESRGLVSASEDVIRLYLSLSLPLEKPTQHPGRTKTPSKIDESLK